MGEEIPVDIYLFSDSLTVRDSVPSFHGFNLALERPVACSF